MARRADTHAPGPPWGTYGLRVPAHCVLYVPEAQGGLPPDPTSVPYAPRAVVITPGGTPLPRANPCWEEGGRTFCLPRFYILGEMKCGTTTLYQLLAKHPRIALPRTKAPTEPEPNPYPIPVPVPVRLRLPLPRSRAT